MTTRSLVLLALTTTALHAQTPQTIARVDSLLTAADESAPPERRALAAQARRIAERGGYAGGVAMAEYQTALATYFAGEPGAEALFATAAATARRARDPRTEGTALAWQGMAATDGGPDQQARGVALMRAGLAVHQRQGGPDGQRNALVPLNLLANYYRYVGQGDSARAMFERSARTAAALGDAEAEGRALAAVGDLSRISGDFVAAARALRRAEGLAVQAADTARADMARLGLARIDAAQGETAAAERAFRRLADANRLGGTLGYTTDPLADLGALYREQGQPERALAAYRRMAEKADADGVPYARDLARVYAADVLFGTGRLPEAREALHPAADSMLAMGTAPEISAVIYRLLATEARLDGRAPEAVAFARQAVDAADTARDAAAARDATAELARSLEAAGDPAGALAALRRSAALSDSLSSTAQARAVGRAEGEAGRAAAEAQRRQALVGAAALGLLLLLGGVGVVVYRRTVRRSAREAAARSAEIARQAEALEAANADLAQTNAVVREAQDAQARFFETASHELRTPLTLTLGPLSDLRHAGTLPPDAQATASLAHANATRLARLVDDLLDAARLDAGEMPHHPEPADIARIATDVGARFSDLADRDGVTLTVHAPPNVPAVVDAAAIERALANLVANALRHTPAGGTVTVSLTANAAEARLAVSDTGPGVPPDALPHLFERFYRADERAGVGSGLGLGLAREWAERHGGRVEAVSPPGEGATFTIVLPLSADAPLAVLAPDDGPLGADAAAPESLVPDADALVVLVAEDNADLRAYVARHLGRAFDRPVTVVEAVDGEDALELARDLVPDLVVSDVRMPRRDGLSLMRELKADLRTSHVPVLLLTARADAPAQAEGFASGADGYLAKPFDAAVLRAQVAALVSERQRLRERLSALAGLDGHAGDGVCLDTAGSEPAPPALSPAETRFLTTVDEAIAARTGDAQFGVEALAETLALSPRQLRRKLRAVSGDTPADRIRRARVAAGTALLAAGTHSVKEAASAVGYADAEGFRRAFVAVRGVQPSEAVPA